MAGRELFGADREGDLAELAQEGQRDGLARLDLTHEGQRDKLARLEGKWDGLISRVTARSETPAPAA